MAPVIYMVDALVRRGWATGCLALESWSRNPNGNVLSELTDGLSGKGVRVVDGSWLVDTARLLKSPREHEFMHTALDIADYAMAVVAAEIRPGMTEIAVASIALAAMMRNGGGHPAIRVAGAYRSAVSGPSLPTQSPSYTAGGTARLRIDA